VRMLPIINGGDSARPPMATYVGIQFLQLFKLLNRNECLFILTPNEFTFQYLHCI